ASADDYRTSAQAGYQAIAQQPHDRHGNGKRSVCSSGKRSVKTLYIPEKDGTPIQHRSFCQECRKTHEPEKEDARVQPLEALLHRLVSGSSEPFDGLSFHGTGKKALIPYGGDQNQQRGYANSGMDGIQSKL